MCRLLSRGWPKKSPKPGNLEAPFSRKNPKKGSAWGKAFCEAALCRSARESLRSGTERKPHERRSQIREVNKREFAVRAFRHRVQISRQRSEHCEQRKIGNHAGRRMRDAMVTEIAWQSNRN